MALPRDGSKKRRVMLAAIEAKNQEKKTNPWTLKVALRPSGVLLVKIIIVFISLIIYIGCLGPFPTYDQDLCNGTSGPKRHFWAFGIGPSAEKVDKSQGKCKNNALGNMTVSGPWMTISCQQRRPCCDNVLNVSCVFSASLISQSV